MGLNRKTGRKATPFTKDMKSSSVNARNKKMVSRKPVFDAIDESAADDAVSEIKEEKIETNEVSKKKKNKLAFDPNKVSSRLFQSTSSSNNKMRKLDTGKKVKKRAETPQVRSSCAKIKKIVKRRIGRV